MLLKIWGTRGSIPVPGKDTIKYGGNTPCVEIRSSNNKLIVLDAGSGIRNLGNDLLENSNSKFDIDIFISHYHWDHIQGIPFFLPLYEKNAKVTFYGIESRGMSIKDALDNQMNDNYFPIKIDQVNARINYKKIKAGNLLNLDGLEVKTFQANHSSPTLIYKILEGDKCIIYMTDNELKYDKNDELMSSVKKLNKDLLEFCHGCDYLIHDTMYDETQLISRKGWGHSSNIILAYFAIAANVKNLVLFHYNPDYTDKKIDAMLEETRQVFLNEGNDINCIAASEGLEIKI